jgi:hypothetical protein
MLVEVLLSVTFFNFQLNKNEILSNYEDFTKKAEVLRTQDIVCGFPRHSCGKTISALFKNSINFILYNTNSLLIVVNMCTTYFIFQ